MVRFLLAVLLAVPALAADQSAIEHFENRVRPLFAKQCFSCHTQTKLGGLEMTSRDALIKGGSRGAAIVPGNPAASLLVKAIRHEHEQLRMPPTGVKLTDEEVASVEAWIRDGAAWPESSALKKTSSYTITAEHRAFWSFQPVRKPSPPQVKNTSIARTPVDQFVVARLEQRGLKPNPSVDRRTLIRRASFDLKGLPPTPEEVDEFLADRSPGAFAKVVDRLLASPRYGERWGRHWLDLARYSDDKLNPTQDEPRPQAFRYRDWVIRAVNDDMPYDKFLKAQIAGDLMNEPSLIAGLGLYSMSPEFQDDRVDVTTRGFMGLTVACAQCHDHKFDPIPTKDYYALQGVFDNTKYYEHPLADKAQVDEYERLNKVAEGREKELRDYVKAQADQLAEILASRTSAYLLAAVEKGDAAGLDEETVDRWKKYLAKSPKEHSYLTPITTAEEAASFEQLAIAVNREKKEIDEKNKITLGGSMERRDLASANLASLSRDKYVLWRDIYGTNGVLIYSDRKIDRFLSGEFKRHLDDLRGRAEAARKAVPEKFPFLHAIQDKDNPKNMRVHIRGNRATLGDEAPRGFLAILSPQGPHLFTKGSGRLELAEAIAAADNPLTARVIVNRVWQWHFGEGLVRTPSNFGQLGERPLHPELLDYLAARFVESGWSMKALHREIMLSSTYALDDGQIAANERIDGDNRLWWRWNRRRLDAEQLRDSVLFATTRLDLTMGGVAEPLTEANRRRTVYGFVSRRKLDPMLAMFDFPNPMSTAEQRIPTDVPLQRLFLLNSGLILRSADELACQIEQIHGEEARITEAYRRLFQRGPSRQEMQAGMAYMKTAPNAWPKYLQVLLSSNEFLYW